MTNRKDESERILTASGRDRRRFVARTAMGALAVYATAIRSQADEAGKCAKLTTTQKNCPDVKVPPMKEVAGKVAFITGGSSGIGLGIARAFTDAGMKVVVGYRTPKHLDEAKQYLAQAKDRLHAISVDVTDRPAMERAAAETIKVFGKVHVLVNNAGVITHGGLRKTTYDDWDWVMSVNCTGIFNGVHAFLPHLEAHHEGGHILATSSVFGLFAGGEMGGYSASKFGAVGLMESLRTELDDTNIGVSVYCPGQVRSDPDAARNRPARFADVGVKPAPATLDHMKKVKQDPEQSMDILEAGRLVLRGMQNNDLYILSHPEWAGNVQDRSEALAASVPGDVDVTEARRQGASAIRRHSLYATERDRKRCAHSEG